MGRYESVESIWGHPELLLVVQMGQTVASARRAVGWI